MISPRTLALHHLKLKEIKLTNTTSSSLNFATDSSIPANSSVPILISLSNRNLYFGRIREHKAEDSKCILIFADGTIYEG